MFEKELGRGGEGVVGLYRRKDDHQPFAVKFEFSAGSNNTMLTEALFMKDATLATPGQNDRIPRYELHGTTGGRKFIIM